MFLRFGRPGRLALALAVALLAPGGVHGQSLPIVRIATAPADSAASAIFAVRSGMFRRAGLDVQLQTMSSGGAVAAAVVGGALDIGYQNVLSTMNAHLRNIPFQVVNPGQMYSSKAPDPVLLIRMDSPLRTARDLNGKTIATSTLHDMGSVALSAWMDKNGGDSSTIHLVEIPYSAMLGALDEGRVDAATVLAPASTQALDSGKVRMLAPFMDAIGLNFPLAAWFATSDWIAAHQDTALRFSRVMREAAIYANAHHDETAPMVAKVTLVDVATLQHGTRSVMAEKLDMDHFQSIIDTLAKYKALDHSFSAREIVSPAVAGVWK